MDDYSNYNAVEETAASVIIIDTKSGNYRVLKKHWDFNQDYTGGHGWNDMVEAFGKNELDGDEEKMVLIRRFRTEALMESLANCETYVTVDVQKKDGIWCRLRGLPSMVDEDGSIKSIIVTIANITGDIRKATEEERIRKRYEKMQEGASRSHDAEFLMNLNEDTYYAFKIAPAVLKFIPREGRKKDLEEKYLKLIAMTMGDNPTDEMLQSLEDMRMKFTTEWMRNNLRNDHLAEMDYHRAREGEERWYRLTFFAVEYDDAGVPLTVMAFTTEITDNIIEQRMLQNRLAQANASLKKEMALLKSFRNIYLLSLHIDLAEWKAHVIDAYDQFRTLVEDYEDDLEGLILKAADYIPDPEYYETFRDFFDLSTLDERLKDKNLVIMEYMTKSGKWHRTHVIVVEKDENGKVTDFIVATLDIDETKRNEFQYQEALKEAAKAAERANQAKTEFLSQMSHDIRTPMNAIIGFSTILLEKSDDSKQVEQFTKKILTSSEQLLVLINDVLDMSKIESGRIDLNIRSFRISDMIESIGAVIRELAKEKQQSYHCFVSDMVNDEYSADEPRVRQILVNLLNNSVKYTQEGGTINFRVRVLKGGAEGRYDKICFVVEDNGRGMSEEFLETAFTPFTRETREDMPSVQGTGLGLTITKNLVELMGGSVDVESEVGKGSRFTVVIPMKAADTEMDIRFCEEHGFMHILVVDDDRESCGNIAETLKVTKAEVDWAYDGNTAVTMAKKACDEKDPYSLVIVDWNMPVKSGVDTVKALRQIIPKDAVVLMMSAYDWNDIEDEARTVGVNGFLAKPFFLSNFRDVLESCISGEDYESFGDRTAEKFGLKGGKDNILSGLSFLVAEDNELNSEIISHILKMNEAEVKLAPNGKVAFETFRDSEPGTYDLILMDIQMPIMNGYEASKAIREITDDESLDAVKRDEAKAIPIIAVTANAFSDDVRFALQSGMNGHIAKPINVEQLKNTVKEVLV